MAIHYEINFNDDFPIHEASLACFYQDDGFGNCINTYNQCNVKDKNMEVFVMGFIYDMFNFV